jgi:hypothetical protein
MAKRRFVYFANLLYEAILPVCRPRPLSQPAAIHRAGIGSLYQLQQRFSEGFRVSRGDQDAGQAAIQHFAALPDVGDGGCKPGGSVFE